MTTWPAASTPWTWKTDLAMSKPIVGAVHSINNGPVHCNIFGGIRWAVLLCGPFDPRIDFAAKRPEVDWLSKQRLRTVLQRLALGLRIAIGRYHDDRYVGPHGLRFRQQLKPAHPRHVDVGQDQDERLVARSGDALKCHRGGLCKF